MLKKTIKRLYSVVWGQSTTKSMRAHIIGLKTFKNFDDEKVSATLLKEIKAVSYKQKGDRNPYLALDDANSKIYRCFQSTFESNTLHYNPFVALIEIVEHHGGTLCSDEFSIEVEGEHLSESFDITTTSQETRAPIKSITRDQILSVTFLIRSDRSRYGQLLDNLENQLSLGTDQDLVDIPSTLTTLDCYVKTSFTQQPRRYLLSHDGSNVVDMAFVQAGSPVPSTDGVKYDGITCFG